jgi:hypothetical protein
VPAHCIPRCALGRTESKLLLAKESNMHGEICVNTKYKHLTLENEGKLPREQLAILITADSASDHIDFPLRNSFFDGFSQNRTFEVPPLVKFGKSQI